MDKGQDSIQHLVSATGLLKKVLIHHGISPEPLFQQAGIDPALLSDPEARVACGLVDDLWELATKKIGEPYFAVEAGRMWHPSFAGALGYSWLASPTLLDGLEKFKRYFSLISGTVTPRLTQSGNGVTMALDYSPGVRFHPNRTIAFLSGLMAICRINFGPTLCPVQVEFIQKAPPSTGAFIDYFRSKVSFSRDRDGITFRLADVTQPLPTGNPRLEEIHDQVLESYVHRMNRRRVADRVASEIADNLTSGKVTDEFIAKRLHMSVRSLQRRLKEEGTGYQAVFDTTRETMARQYFKDPDLCLEEIAYLTGFSEYSSFSRAFKRWTGESPSQLRIQLTNPSTSTSS
ncbi:MAG: AraC family transcriptional regulator [Desulfobacterales bacterium]|nr:AraC family transcriptional regulator [Desulfobacterales bacterium]